MKPLPISWRMRGVQLFALWGFAVAQPIYETLKDEPFWFAVQGYDGVDVVIYAVALLVVPPVVLLGVERLLGLASSRLAGFAHGLFVVALAAFIIGRALDVVELGYRVLAALACAFIFERLLRAWYPMRLFVSICSVAPIVFVAIFVQSAPLAALSKQDAPVVASQSIEGDTPVVVIIFDEFPTESLMTPNRRVDRVRYPSFAALASTATWYRNASTVHDYTFWAVPAILDGRRPSQDELPTVADHGQNLLTLLSGSDYEVHAFESVTRLCPAGVCPQRPQPSVLRRIRDAGVHVERSLKSFLFLTGSYQPELPDWINPTGQVERFLDAVQPRAGRQLYVLHVLLPHSPWRFLPSGRTYDSQLAGLAHGRWTSNERDVDRSYQRHLLQVGYVDRVLGEIARKLKDTGLWDRSLLVVTADHGVSFHPGDERRTVDLANVADIAFVPLFVKTPRQRVGRVDDHEARTIDVVPTIADTLGFLVPWHVDGRSLRAADRPLHPGVVVASAAGPAIHASWATLERQRADTMSQKTELFGAGDDPRLVSGLPEREISARTGR